MCPSRLPFSESSLKPTCTPRHTHPPAFSVALNHFIPPEPKYRAMGIKILLIYKTQTGDPAIVSTLHYFYIMQS